ncbi:MAG: hypothetical protein GY797_41120 [Deltaproteobacteria bacterium]|nr:hypothetical protein [Deltaproteobacteria bacterium]
MSDKMNCWEFKKCGRELGGAKIEKFGICPAAKEVRASGIHGGKNGGRSCWVLTGTFCGGDVQGSFASKLGNCHNCDFYQKVEQEEMVFMDNSDIIYEIKFGNR